MLTNRNTEGVKEHFIKSWSEAESSISEKLSMALFLTSVDTGTSSPIPILCLSSAHIKAI